MVCSSETACLNSDRQLEDRLQSALRRQSFWALRNVQVTASEGRVTLAGEVPTFYARQVCQETCRHVPGVVQIVDNVTVMDWQQ